MTACKADIDRFLSLPHIALIGVSRKQGQYSRTVFQELRKATAALTPVNPNAREIDGAPCSASIADVRPTPGGAILLIHAGAVLQTVRDCIRAGVRMIWLRQAESTSEAHRQAAEECRQAGVVLIAGECPLMFLDGGHWIHRLHGGLRKLTCSCPV